MMLIPNWRKAWRMISMQCMAAAVALQGAWAALGADMKEALPEGTLRWVAYATIALLFIGMGGRVIKQPKVNKNETPPSP